MDVAAGLAVWPQHRWHLLELHARGQRNADAEDEHLAGAERRNEGEQACRRIRHRRSDQILVVVVRQPHHEQRAALGDDFGVDLGRALGHEPEKDAVFAAFFGDARQSAAGRPEADLGIGRRIAVRFLANEQKGDGGFRRPFCPGTS